MKRSWMKWLGLLVVIGMLAGCSASAKKPVVVASKDFAEQYIVGEMYALLLEEAGIPVERKLGLGGTPIAHEAIKNGQIDLYPEYTGTALLTVLKLPTEADRDVVYQTVSKAYGEQFHLIWLEPAPMNNTQALATTQEVADQYGLRTISDMAAHAASLRMAGPAEFSEREDGLPGIQKAYGGFELAQYVAVEKGLRYQALTNGQADIAVAFGTDGEIAAFKLVVLEDDKHLFPPYQLAPVVRQATLDSYPQIKEQLNKLAPLLTDAVMQQLNYEVSGKQREPADVAKEFLQQQGLIK